MSETAGDPKDATRPYTVGMIGLGRMGGPMAYHLARGGYRVVGFDSGDIAAQTAACLSEVMADPASVGHAAFITFVVVPDDEAVRAVCLGSHGLFSTGLAGGIVGICSSVRPETIRSLAEPARQADAELLDIPLTKGVRAAEAGSMTVLAGGGSAVLARAQPVLDCFATTVHHVGGLGDGQTAKTVNNVLLWSNMVSMAEALRLGAALGVPPRILRGALADCSADSWVLREFDRIQPTWPRKDMDIALSLAEQAGLTLPALAEVARTVPDYDRTALDRILTNEQGRNTAEKQGG